MAIVPREPTIAVKERPQRPKSGSLRPCCHGWPRIKNKKVDEQDRYSLRRHWRHRRFWRRGLISRHPEYFQKYVSLCYFRACSSWRRTEDEGWRRSVKDNEKVVVQTDEVRLGKKIWLGRILASGPQICCPLGNRAAQGKTDQISPKGKKKSEGILSGERNHKTIIMIITTVGVRVRAARQGKLSSAFRRGLMCVDGGTQHHHYYHPPSTIQQQLPGLGRGRSPGERDL